MNNEELKKKIVEVVLNSEITGIQIRAITGGVSTANSIADALISAGIGDVKDLQAQVDVLEITNIALQAGYDDAEKDRLYWVDKYKEEEHRAEVAERALKDRAAYCATYCVMEGMDCFSLTSVAIEARAKELYKSWRRKAEKELAEVEK